MSNKKVRLKIGWVVLFALAVAAIIMLEHQLMYEEKTSNQWLIRQHLKQKIDAVKRQSIEIQKDHHGEIGRSNENHVQTQREIDFAVAELSFLKKKQQELLIEKEKELDILREKLSKLETTPLEISRTNVTISNKETDLLIIKKHLLDLKEKKDIARFMGSKKGYRLEIHNSCKDGVLNHISYNSSIVAMAACDMDHACFGIYDNKCDGRPPFFLCQDQSTWKDSTKSCVRKKPGTWKFYRKSYLPEYADSGLVHEFENLFEAQQQCLTLSDCGGITQSSSKLWELRRDRMPKTSNLGENSWIRPEKEHNKQTVKKIMNNSIYDSDYILQHMSYWRITHTSKSLNLYDKYLSITFTCCSFNSIRISFEYMVIIAYLTRRTLIMPISKPWCWIDCGTVTSTESKASKYHSDFFYDFFDMKDLQAIIPIITTQEFIMKEKHRLVIPDKFSDSNYILKHPEDWEKWLLSLKVNQHWGQMIYVLYWPDKKSFNDANITKIGGLIDQRQPVEYTDPVKQSQLIHFPSCYLKDDSFLPYRYIEQVPSVVRYNDPELEDSMKRILRDHVHYTPLVFEIASKVVSVMGMGNYSSIHIRRNDMQDKNIYESVQTILYNVRVLLNPREKIYLSTDEISPEFFKVFEKEFSLYRWKDFFGDRGNNVLRGIKIDKKIEACIEQAICAMARKFFGTEESAFSAYITRLRYYMNARDKNTYFHSTYYSGDPVKDRHHFRNIGKLQ